MRARLNRYLERVQEELLEAFAGDYTSQEIAGSFALGVFITMLPTLGTGLLVFVVLSYLFARISKVALFASVLVLNPAVKWGVYGTSISLGTFLLGPVEGIESVRSAVSLDVGWDVLVRLWVGNLILAVVATAIAYPLAHKTVTSYRNRELGLLETVTDPIASRVTTGSESTADTADEQPDVE
ncbi:DUF2062 domain-containing protein [Halohasta salina]|uniref:DUF2062 domain-containing protein n=1 Tax=Halohasta salina TaxID=2961621 RepID=UPI0020A5630F|nr:DUF2062 domain-containing protein [Halohasta salina]